MALEGEECDVNVTFPEVYHAEELKGKAAVFKVKINAIKTQELPELDDEFAKDASEFLNDNLEFDKAGVPLCNHQINKFKPLFARIEKTAIDKMIETSKEDLKQAQAQAAPAKAQESATSEYEPLADEITIDDFMKTELRVGKVIECEKIKNKGDCIWFNGCCDFWSYR